MPPLCIPAGKLLNTNAELSSPVSEGKFKMRQLALESVASAVAKVIAQAFRKLVLCGR